MKAPGPMSNDKNPTLKDKVLRQNYKLDRNLQIMAKAIFLWK